MSGHPQGAEDPVRRPARRLAAATFALVVAIPLAVPGCYPQSGRTPDEEVTGADRDAPPVPRVSAVERAEILGLSDELTRIYKSGDWPALASLVAPDYLGTAPGVEWDVARLKEEFPKVRLVDCRTDAVTVKALAPGLVLLNQDAFLKESYDGQDISGRYRFTTIWTRREGRWQLLFEEEVPLPATAEAGSS
jgi:hypothetical protein